MSKPNRQDVVQLLVGVYVVVVAITTGVSGAFGPAASVADSLPGIGLVIALRNRLQDVWHPRKVYLLVPVIFLGALGSITANIPHPRVAAASFLAFLAANLVATAIYRPGNRVRMGLSIVAFAVIDSLVFPPIAFGSFVWWVVGGQIAAKIVGAVAWTIALRRLLPEEDA